MSCDSPQADRALLPPLQAAESARVIQAKRELTVILFPLLHSLTFNASTLQVCMRLGSTFKPRHIHTQSSDYVYSNFNICNFFLIFIIYFKFTVFQMTLSNEQLSPLSFLYVFPSFIYLFILI